MVVTGHVSIMEEAQAKKVWLEFHKQSTSLDANGTRHCQAGPATVTKRQREMAVNNYF